MSELVPGDDIPADPDALLDYLADLVEQGHQAAAVRANAALTVTCWRVGRAISVSALRAGRGSYGREILAVLGQELGSRFGAGFDRSNLNRIVAFARQFPDYGQVTALARQLSWSHVRTLLALKSDEARSFYAQEASAKHLSVRELRDAIGRKAHERREIAGAQIPEGSALPRDTFSDPLILDALGLRDTFLEQDLKAAVLRDVQAFLMEAGRGLAFIASQKRMTIDGDDCYLDQLFYCRPLRRLVAVELKTGKFDARFEGQMKRYLKWLDRYERQDGEQAPLGLILCTEVSREQVELLEMHKDGIVVTDSWAALPPRAELQGKLAEIVRDAQERLARRGFTARADAQGGGQLAAPE